MTAYILPLMPSFYELLPILIVVLLLFGGKKIPELMKGLGSGIKEFKKATSDEDETPKKEEKKEE